VGQQPLVHAADTVAVAALRQDLHRLALTEIVQAYGAVSFGPLRGGATGARVLERLAGESLDNVSDGRFRGALPVELPAEFLVRHLADGALQALMRKERGPGSLLQLVGVLEQYEVIWQQHPQGMVGRRKQCIRDVHWASWSTNIRLALIPSCGYTE